MMKKILVIGCPGAGKTTFSNKLAQKTKLPLIHLDKHYYDPRHNYEYDKEPWRSRVAELVSARKWVIDGNYKSTFDVRMPAADTIIFLDYPRWLCLWRVFKRRIKYHRKTRPDMAEDWQEKANFEFLRHIWDFKENGRPLIYKALNNHKDKNIIIFKKSVETKHFLAAL
jgi:adenylate kinase family enzyme